MYNERTDTELFLETRDPRGNAAMHEPTQEFIVSELRRRMRVSIAELTQMLGLQFASVLPQEIQRMKASGLVVYDELLTVFSPQLASVTSSHVPRIVCTSMQLLPVSCHTGSSAHDRITTLRRCTAAR